MNWAQFYDPVSTVVVSWSLIQDVAVWQVRTLLL